MGRCTQVRLQHRRADADETRVVSRTKSSPDPRMTADHNRKTSSRNRRKKLVVLQQMQSRIIKETTLFPLVALTILTITLTVFSRRLMAEAAAEEVVLPTLEPLLASVICLTAGFAITILYVALRFSQRIAGPTYRITQSLKDVQEGKLDLRIKLRDGDFLEEIAQELNVTLALIESLKGSPAGNAQTASPVADEASAAVDAAPSLTSEAPTI